MKKEAQTNSQKANDIIKLVSYLESKIEQNQSRITDWESDAKNAWEKDEDEDKPTWQNYFASSYYNSMIKELQIENEAFRNHSIVLAKSIMDIFK